MVSLSLLLLLLVQFVSKIEAFSCKSINGNDVDWFYGYKLPILENDQRQGASQGTAFLYADSSSSGWKLSSEGIDSPRSAVGLTIKQLFKISKGEFYALYNDEHPNNKTDSSRGHMKGVLLFNDFNGIWMIHSVPKFPSRASGTYTYPESGKRNGQSFLCITFPTTHLDEIGKQLVFGQPSVYEKQLPTSFERLYPNLAAAVSGKSPSRKLQRGVGYSSIAPLTSVGGRRFISFSKHKKYGKDLYSDLVAPELQSSLYVETWLNGGGDLSSECDTPYKVYNLRSVRPFTYNFKNSNDHSKWAVSTNTDNPWICIGDINRQKSQEGRGGGTMCLADARISALYRLAAGDVECCGDRSRNRTPKSVWHMIGNMFSGRPKQQSPKSGSEPPGCVPPPVPSGRRKRTTAKRFLHNIKAGFERYLNV